MYQHGPMCLRGPVSRRRRNWKAVPMKGRIPAEPALRHELIARVRAEIAAGTYETPEKWQHALERLAERLEWA
jgi:hypothetical protein